MAAASALAASDVDASSGNPDFDLTVLIAAGHAHRAVVTLPDEDAVARSAVLVAPLVDGLDPDAAVVPGDPGTLVAVLVATAVVAAGHTGVTALQVEGDAAATDRDRRASGAAGLGSTDLPLCTALVRMQARCTVGDRCYHCLLYTSDAADE